MNRSSFQEIGNTFIRTLTHAHYSKDVFLVRLEAWKVFLFFYLVLLLFSYLLDLTNDIREQKLADSLSDILMVLCECLQLQQSWNTMKGKQGASLGRFTSTGSVCAMTKQNHTLNNFNGTNVKETLNGVSLVF